jgi:hypothetical protein
VNGSEAGFISYHVGANPFDWFGCIDSAACRMCKAGPSEAAWGQSVRELTADEERENKSPNQPYSYRSSVCSDRLA